MKDPPGKLPINKIDMGKIRKRISQENDLDGRTAALLNRFAFWFSKWAQPETTGKAGVDRLPKDFQSVEAEGEPGQLVKAKVLYGKQPDLHFPSTFSSEGKKQGRNSKVPRDRWSENDSRVAFARWLTDKNNPRFSLILANRLWKKP